METYFSQLEIGEEFTFPGSNGRYRKINSDEKFNSVVLRYGGASPVGTKATFHHYDPVIGLGLKSQIPPKLQSDIDQLWEVFTEASDAESSAKLVLYSDGTGFIENDEEANITFSSLQGAIDNIRGKKL